MTDPIDAEKTRTVPEQIPLLEDVVVDVNPPVLTPQQVVRTSVHVSDDPLGPLQVSVPVTQPRATDLFPEVMVLKQSIAETDELSQQAAERVAGSLAKVYPPGVIRKLRDELTLLLEELNDVAAPSASQTED